MKGSFTLLILVLLARPLVTTAQYEIITPTVINSAGGSGAADYYRFDWSVGEMCIIETYQAANMVLENGFLHAGFAVGLPPVNFFASGDIVIYPNPVFTSTQVNLNVPNPGRLSMKVTNSMGQPVMIREFDYDGAARTEKVELTGLPTGTYFLYISIKPFDMTAAREITGVYKLVKITR